MQEELLYLAGIEENEEQQALDYVRMKGFYPKEIVKYNQIVEEECDKLEYDGSLMYAEIVDRSALEQVAERVTAQCINCNECSHKGYGGFFRPEQYMDVIYPWILTMLCNEMHVRRVRKCRRDKRFR